MGGSALRGLLVSAKGHNAMHIACLGGMVRGAKRKQGAGRRGCKPKGKGALQSSKQCGAQCMQAREQQELGGEVQSDVHIACCRVSRKEERAQGKGDTRRGRQRWGLNKEVTGEVHSAR